VIQAALDLGHLQDGLLLLQLERQMRGDGVGQPPGVVNARQRGEDFRRNFLVEFDVVVELSQQRAPHGLDFTVVQADLGHRFAARQKMRVGVDEFLHPHALIAFHQHLHGAVRQLEHLQDAGDGADFIKVVEAGLILGGGFLRHQHDVFAGFHRQFQRLDRLRPSHEQGDDHVWEHHHVAQRQQRQLDGGGKQDALAHGISGVERLCGSS